MNKTVICLVQNLTSSVDRVAAVFYQAGHGNLPVYCVVKTSISIP